MRRVSLYIVSRAVLNLVAHYFLENISTQPIRSEERNKIMENPPEFLVLDPGDTLIFNGLYFERFFFLTIHNFLGKLGAQSSVTLKISNSSYTAGYFKVKSSHAKYYAVVPATGMIKPSESLKIQIISKELPLDCEKHEFKILSAIANMNADANTFWKKVQPGNYRSKKLTVQISSNGRFFHSNNAYVSKQQTLNKEQLELYIRSAVENGQPLLSIEEQLFPNPNVVPKAVKQFVTKQYTEYLIEVLKHNFKDASIAMVQQG